MFSPRFHFPLICVSANKDFNLCFYSHWCIFLSFIWQTSFIFCTILVCKAYLWQGVSWFHWPVSDYLLFLFWSCYLLLSFLFLFATEMQQLQKRTDRLEIRWFLPVYLSWVILHWISISVFMPLTHIRISIGHFFPNRLFLT